MCASVNVTVLAVIFRSVVHFELIFVDSVSQGSHFILLHSGVQLSKYRSHHLGLINLYRENESTSFSSTIPQKRVPSTNKKRLQDSSLLVPGTRKPRWKPQSVEMQHLPPSSPLGLAKFQEVQHMRVQFRITCPGRIFQHFLSLRASTVFLEGRGGLVFLEMLTPSRRLGPAEGTGSLILSSVCHLGWTGRRSQPSSGFLKLSSELMWEEQ